MVSFADDTRVNRQINDINECDYLQYDLDNHCYPYSLHMTKSLYDLDNVYTWATVNNMAFNDGKFQHIYYHHQTKHKSENHIYLSPSKSSLYIINSQQQLKYLEVTMSSDCLSVST